MTTAKATEDAEQAQLRERLLKMHQHLGCEPGKMTTLYGETTLLEVSLLLRDAAAALASRQPGEVNEPEAGPPVFWRHAISECNEAHQALDRLDAPKTRTVRRIQGEGQQEITMGLADRILSLPRAHAEPQSIEAQLRKESVYDRNATLLLFAIEFVRNRSPKMGADLVRALTPSGEV